MRIRELVKRARLLKRLLDLESWKEKAAKELGHLQAGAIVCAGNCGGLFWGPSNKLTKVKTGTEPEDFVWVCIRCRSAGIRNGDLKSPRQRRKSRRGRRGT